MGSSPYDPADLDDLLARGEQASVCVQLVDATAAKRLVQALYYRKRRRGGGDGSRTKIVYAASEPTSVRIEPRSDGILVAVQASPVQPTEVE